MVKFVFFEKATKFDEIFILLLTNKFMFFVSRYSFENQSLLYFIYFVSDIRNVQNCVAILKLLNICAIKKSNFLGLARGKIWNSTGAQTLIIQEQNKENSASNFTHDQKIKAKGLNKTQFVALGFVVPRITLENCEETAKGQLIL